MQSELARFFQTHDAVMQVTLRALKGSSPREAGASLYVSKDALHGTIGGGQLEYLAIDEARRLLRQGAAEAEMTVPLGPEIGQCCGGVVTLGFARLDAEARRRLLVEEAMVLAEQPCVLVFGSGHVGRALASALALLPVRAMVIDSRAEELALLTADVETHYLPLPEAAIRSAPAGSAFVILTHDHALDFLLAREALFREDAAYVGMIGSKSKLGTFRHWFLSEQSEGADAAKARLSRLICPIGGGGSRDKRPQVIAAMVAAEVMTALDRATLRSDMPAEPIATLT